MSDKNKRGKFEAIVDGVLAQTSFELVLCEFGKQGPDWILRVYIDHPEGVTLAHCQQVTRMLLDALEENDPSDKEYQIEVSSPGVDRPLVKLGDYQRFLSERVFVKLHRPSDGRKKLTGILTACDGERITVLNEEDQGTYTFTIDDVAKATLKPILDFS